MNATSTTTALSGPYAARLTIDYPQHLDRLSTAFRLLWAVPILVVLGFLTSTGEQGARLTPAGEQVAGSGGGMVVGLGVATAVMIVVRMRYPRWWFDFA